MKKTGLLSLIILLSIFTLSAQHKDEQPIADAVKALNQAMIDGNQSKLEQLTSPHLSYGHSSGLVENKEEFVTAITGGKFGFTSIDLTEQTISVMGNVAIVRHTFFAGTDNKGQAPGTVKLAVMQVWQKEKGKWLLIGRQATKI